MSNALCDDWRCPARVSCAHHFGRSRAYAAGSPQHPPLRRFERDAGAEACPAYVRDKPRAWLVPAPATRGPAGARTG